jgi:hypothetical protein
MPRECAACSSNPYDQFGIYVNPTDYAWEHVDGGGGQLLDPVDGPTGLRSLWTFGGTANQPSAAGSDGAIIAVSGGAPQYLTVMLDTATGRSDDEAYASWGSITNLRAVPYIGTTAQPALTLTWTPSPIDPAGTSISVDANGADIGLATQSFGASSRATQDEGIWGAGAVLPGRDAAGTAYTSYRLTFDYDLRSHDTRGSMQQQSAVGEQVSMQWVVLAVLAATLIRRRGL